MMALIALAEAASSVIYLQYVQRPRVVQLAALTALYVDAVRASLSGRSSAERAAFRDEINASQRVRLLPETAAVPPSTWARARHRRCFPRPDRWKSRPWPKASTV